MLCSIQKEDTEICNIAFENIKYFIIRFLGRGIVISPHKIHDWRHYSNNVVHFHFPILNTRIESVKALLRILHSKGQIQHAEWILNVVWLCPYKKHFEIQRITVPNALTEPSQRY